MEISGIGKFVKDNKSDSYYSEEIPVKILSGQKCRIILEGYDDDRNKEDFHNAIKNFCTINQSVFREAEEHIFQYYQDCKENWYPDDSGYVRIETPGDIWKHIQPGYEVIVERRRYGDKEIYVSLECECDWEVEHGLQIVFKNGLKVNKVGPYDGHFTNSDAYNDKNLESIIYKPI